MLLFRRTLMFCPFLINYEFITLCCNISQNLRNYPIFVKQNLLNSNLGKKATKYLQFKIRKAC